MRIELDHRATVEVDGTTVPDPEPALPGPPLLAVAVRMPGFLAHSLSHALSEFTQVCELVEASGRIGWQQYTCALHRAAREAGGEAGCHAVDVDSADRQVSV